MPFELPLLSYSFDALEPYIDAKTMQIHYTKHHNAYVTNLNSAIKGTSAEYKTLEDICKSISNYSSAVRNNAGGHYNHSFFWKMMKPNGGGEPSEELSEAIKKAFGSFEDFKTQFTNVAIARFGSGWVWVCVNDGKLNICSTPNQNNPLMDDSACHGIPVLALDVWEHAYYLNYYNKRIDYINAFFNVLDWNKVNEHYERSKSMVEVWRKN